MSAAETTTHPAPAPTLGQLRAAAARLATDEGAEYFGGRPIPRELLGALIEHARLGEPARGLAYPREIDDAMAWLQAHAGIAGEPLFVRLLGLVADDIDLYELARRDDVPMLRDAARELVRALAIYFVREHAHYMADDPGVTQ